MSARVKSKRDIIGQQSLHFTDIRITSPCVVTDQQSLRGGDKVIIKPDHQCYLVVAVKTEMIIKKTGVIH